MTVLRITDWVLSPNTTSASWPWKGQEALQKRGRKGKSRSLSRGAVKYVSWSHALRGLCSHGYCTKSGPSTHTHFITSGEAAQKTAFPRNCSRNSKQGTGGHFLPHTSYASNPHLNSVAHEGEIGGGGGIMGKKKGFWGKERGMRDNSEGDENDRNSLCTCKLSKNLFRERESVCWIRMLSPSVN